MSKVRKPINVINQPTPTPVPLPPAPVAHPNCGLSLTQENTYYHVTNFHFDPVPGATDYVMFYHYDQPDCHQVTYYNPTVTGANVVQLSQIFAPLQNTQYTYDLVAYSPTAVLCVQSVTFTTNYLA